MRIQELTLYTNQLSEQRGFFQQILGFEQIENENQAFTVQIGSTKLRWKHKEQGHVYHYCFLIPSNKLQESIAWLRERLEIVKIEGERITQVFENWNAESVYFYDAAGNIAEFIVRYDLQNETNEAFDTSHILCVNEIGMPTSDVAKINQQLEDVGSPFWKGDLERFGTNGTQDGLFLLVNNEIKKTWFPVDIPAESAPFEGVFLINQRRQKIEFRDQKVYT